MGAFYTADIIHQCIFNLEIKMNFIVILQPPYILEVYTIL